jgi:probable O-glycosylation ligase (exosortase A-associated)
MRDVLVATIVFGALPVILFRPYVGVLVFAWLGYMNPHRLSFGFAYDFPFAFIVGLTTLFAILFSSERKRFPLTPLTVLWLLFVVWMGITTIYAFYPDAALIQYEKVLKIQLMSFVAILLITTPERLRMFIWVIVLSLGYFGVKGGVFTVLTAGNFHVWGPPGTFVEGNNEVALALLMVLPLMQYLRLTSPSKWVRWGLLVAMGACAFAVVGSQSRGALVGGLAMAFFLWMKSKHKLATGVFLAILVPLLLTFMPDQWRDRMRTIESYDEDSSAVSRLQTWQMALNLANNQPLGGGFEMWTERTFERYSPDKRDPHDAHSIYFKVLGEHGWIGFTLFALIGLLAWRTGTWITKRCDRDPRMRWLSDLARMAQVSLAAYAAGGAFLGLSYFDLFWNLVAILVIGKMFAQQEFARVEPASAGKRVRFAYQGTSAP